MEITTPILLANLALEAIAQFDGIRVGVREQDLGMYWWQQGRNNAILALMGGVAFLLLRAGAIYSAKEGDLVTASILSQHATSQLICAAVAGGDALISGGLGTLWQQIEDWWYY